MLTMHELRGPVEHSVLPQLDAASLTRLGCSCSSLRASVTSLPLSVWQAAAARLLPQAATACAGPLEVSTVVSIRFFFPLQHLECAQIHGQSYNNAC